MKMKVFADLEWVVGHVHSGHFGGTLDLPDAEYNEFASNPIAYLKKHFELLDDLDLIVDDASIEDYGDIIEVEVCPLEFKNCKRIELEL